MCENTSGRTDFFFQLIKMCGAAVMISSVFPLAADNTTKQTQWRTQAADNSWHMRILSQVYIIRKRAKNPIKFPTDWLKNIPFKIS